MPTKSWDVYQENTSMPTESSEVYNDIQDIIRTFFYGIPLSSLPFLEMLYQQRFQGSPPDYESVGVENIRGLILQMRDNHMVLLTEDPENKETIVMCTDSVEIRQNGCLKSNIEELLSEHGGEIPLSSFEGIYKDKFKVKLIYHHYGLTGFSHLCEVLNLEVEEANSPGEKVIKAGKIYNSRKGKKEVLSLVVEEANSPGEKVIKAGEIYNSRKRKKEVLNLVVEEANSPGEKVIKAGKIYNLRKRKK